MSSPRLVTIDAEYFLPGIAACYLREQDGEVAFIDNNTSLAVPRLLAALEREGLRPEQVRWIVVTHVHLDHAGGTAALLAACPNATVVCHPRAARHLIDPSRLVASSEAVYGKERFAALYGRIDPVPAERVRAVEEGEAIELGSARLPILHTRGHANHHITMHDPARDTVYTGDSFGLVYPHLQKGGRFAIASTSPTDFDPEEARRSVQRILALGTKSFCPTHFGEIENPAEVAEQLLWWIDRAEALLEEATEMEPARAKDRVRDALEGLVDSFAERVGVRLGETERSLLSLDLELNAQGIAWVAGRRQKERAAG